MYNTKHKFFGVSMKSKFNIDVVNLEWTSQPSRDRQMATLICNYLRIMGKKVFEASVFDGYHVLYRYRPKVFFITNSTGAPENYHLMKYADSLGIKGISLISEGNIRDGGDKVVRDFVWGWNKEEIMYEKVNLLWSHKSRSTVLKYYPLLSSKTKVGGGVGFDVYKIAPRTLRDSILQKYQKTSFEKVIGIGCWDFGPFSPQDSRYNDQISIYGKNGVARFLQDREGFKKIIGDITDSFSDILFIIKEHPGVMLGRWASGIESLEGKENILILKNEESLFDCLSISDLWFVYESTTALEAWLLGIPTGLLNPSGRDFPRANVHEGSPCFTTSEEAIYAIQFFYKTGDLPGFLDLAIERERIIKETIEWADGLNHVRVGNAILDILDHAEEVSVIAEQPEDRRRRIRQHLGWHASRVLGIIPRFRSIKEHRRVFCISELERFAKKRMSEQLAFYTSRGLSISDLRNFVAEN